MRVLLLDDGQLHDVFDVVEITDTLVRARTPFRFEIGEEMKLRIERDGGTSDDVVARVRGHVGGPDAITELELGEPGT
ncbi:MAG: hypothetical protein ACM31C_12750 [Acidobacteriota bacterium]